MATDPLRRAALSILREGRCSVIRATCNETYLPTRVLARVRSSRPHGGYYTVELHLDRTWSCTCSSVFATSNCSHRAAVSAGDARRDPTAQCPRGTVRAGVVTRPVFFLAGLLVVASLGLVVWLAVAPSPAPATAPVPPTVAPSACERALAANLTVADRALTDYQHGRARAGRDLWLSETAALPVGCGR